MSPDLWCGKCGGWLEVVKNGIEIRPIMNYVRTGDLYKCRLCGALIVAGLSDAVYRPWRQEIIA